MLVEYIEEYSWDNKNSATGAESTYGKNNWTDSRINYLLNEGHESESVGGSLYWYSGSGTCYSGQNNATVDCDFTETGLKEETKNMIGNALWYLGGSNDYEDVTTSMFYERERGTMTYKGRDTSWVGKVGLMYPSDFGYATSGGIDTDRNACLNSGLGNWSNFIDFNTNDWLFDEVNWNSEWTLTIYASNSYDVFFVRTSYYLYPDKAYINIWIRPVVFLKSSIKIVDGDGSSSNPYILQA